MQSFILAKKPVFHMKGQRCRKQGTGKCWGQDSTGIATVTLQMTAGMKWGLSVGGFSVGLSPRDPQQFVTGLCFHSHEFAEMMVPLPEAVGNFYFSK